MSKSDRIYLIFLKPPIKNSFLGDYLDSELEWQENLNITIPKGYRWLYAYSESKKDVKKFLEVRNKSLFSVIDYSIDYLFPEYEDYEEFTKMAKLLLLQDRALVTKGVKNHKFKLQTIKLILTELEVSFIDIHYEGVDEDLYDMYLEIDIIKAICECMSDNVLKLMRDAQFLTFIKLIEIAYQNVIPHFLLNIDELFVLLSYFSELFVGGFYHENLEL